MSKTKEVEKALNVYLDDYNWDLWATMPNSNARQYIDELGINITFYLDSGDFELGYNVPKCTYVVKVKGGSFYSLEHFRGMYDQITSIVAVLGTHPYADTHWKTGYRTLGKSTEI